MDKEQQKKIGHTLAHLTAAAVRELWPGSQNAIGPAIENGFYQDFEIAFGDAKSNTDQHRSDADLRAISDNDLLKIEKQIKKLIPKWTHFETKEVSKEEALKEFEWNIYKTELINEFVKDGKTITFHNSPTMVDLCKGGHVENPSKDINPDAFKLTHIAGAYWRGDEKNKMLTRIYGVAFETKKELDAHLAMLEEAKKRDHRKLGTQLDLFTISSLVGKGLPLFTPKGTLLRELLNEYSQSLRAEKGWQKVWSPNITKNDLYKVSGHWDKFGEELFLVKSQETTDEIVMKPMNCPHHQQIYASRPRSYRDLPLKFMETTTVYRDEKAGELLGLSRVRSITQDDGHAFCTPDQIEDIFKDLIKVTKTFYEKIGMPLKARLSYRDPNEPDKYLGGLDLWEKAQQAILKIAKESELDYYEAEGEAAFYGPKIDFMAIDALDREWQLATPQLDFVQPKRFGLTYTDKDGSDQTPVMIHFALMGSIERFLSVYIEHTAGAFPLWLSPVQISVLPIADRHADKANEIANTLQQSGLRVDVNSSLESIGKKIREAELQKIPYAIILGDKEIEEKKVAVRQRKKGDLGQMDLDTFIKQLNKEVEDKVI